MNPLEALDDLTRADPPPALQRLATAFALGDFEQRLVMLAFALETEPRAAALIAQATGERQVEGVPLALAHAVLQAGSWQASSPLAPLRRWRILEAARPAPRALLCVRLAENVTDAMLGLVGLDSALEPVVQALSGGEAASAEFTRELGNALARRDGQGLSPVIVARWPDGVRTAASLAAQLGLRPYRLDAERLAASSDRIALLRHLWERDMALAPGVLIVEQPIEGDATAAVAAFCSGLASHVIVLGDTAPAGLRRAVFRIRRPQVRCADAVALWRDALGETASARLNGSVERAATHFALAPFAISAVAAEIRQAVETAPDEAGAERALWEACGRAAWPDPGPLACVQQPQAAWIDLVVPQAIQEDLRAIVRQVRHAATVFEQWGFAAGQARGRGLLALFAGPSGTGKTLAAEVIAAELRLPLVRADFSQLQSKWVGETPKLVCRLFDELEAGGAVLLIDEADGLIGRRGAVVEAHDRHANVEIGYFLQRLEAFRGLAILTTNLKSAIDEAFLRRMRFVVDFPMPGYAERVTIWRRVFPGAAPLHGVDADVLARLPLSGGNIRNVALNAAFLAAEAGASIQSEHVISALRAEYRKLERPMAEIDIGVLA